MLAHKGKTKVAIESSGQVKLMRRACTAKCATDSPAYDVCGYFGAGFPISKDFSRRSHQWRHYHEI